MRTLGAGILITSSQESKPGLTSDSLDIQTARLKRRPSLLICIFAFSLTAYFALAQVWNWPNRLRYPGEEDAAEGTQLAEMVHLRQGIKIYREPSNGEFDSAIYGPFCYLLGAVVVNPQQPAYLPLRLLSLFATLGLVGLSSALAWHLTGSKFGAALAPLLLLSNAYIARYGISARADMVALLLSFAGFFVLFRWRENRWAVILGSALMLLSFFYKQQFIAAPTAAVIYLLATKRFRGALHFVATMAIGAAALVGVFSWVIFPGQHFLTHFLGYNHLPFEKQLIVPEILMFVVPLFVLLLGSADFLDSHPDKLVKYYALLAVGAFFVLLFSSGSGADTNRCLEATLILTCLMAARITTSETLLGGLAWTSSLGATFFLVALLSSAFVVPKVTPADFAADRALQNYLRNNFAQQTPILTYYAADPLRAGMGAPVTNLWHYSALIRKGVITDGEITRRINNRGYGAILLDFELTNSNFEKVGDFYTTPAMRKTVLAGYYDSAQLELPTPEVTRFSTKTLHVWLPKLTRPGAHK